MAVESAMMAQLHACYDVLCSASYWLAPTTAEGQVVLGSVHTRIRALEAFLQVKEPLHLPAIGAAVDAAANGLGRNRVTEILRKGDGGFHGISGGPSNIGGGGAAPGGQMSPAVCNPKPMPGCGGGGGAPSPFAKAASHLSAVGDAIKNNLTPPTPG